MLLCILARGGYDNWLVNKALKTNISVIDATRTVHALHQTGQDGNYASHQHEDPQYNMNILPAFDASLSDLMSFF